ncbi:hypothetical protein OPV22_007402 [Ensete ventricosum]|uniref:Uncharacterized protein n=1 Tax=Ensete ventricosum TaxID=4639 RepID=A0AAV8Q8H7_ENSVE|nr:hypothetical protein OPV22_007402 [Ensete ventricosum]
MVRAPCCGIGVKKGPWSPEEDETLVGYIQRYGHGNWRALPKQAGLLRCGKSCRLRWMNYLRPDIKRGTFSHEEQETVIRLHETFGNRWSAIAASLPGRTDNEIKNVWHSHLKKLVSPNTSSREPKKKTNGGGSRSKKASEPITTQPDTDSENALFVSAASQAQSNSDFSSCATDSPTVSRGISDDARGSFSSDAFPEIDESFWLDALSMDESAASVDLPPVGDEHSDLLVSFDSDDMVFWLTFLEGVEDLQELSRI